MWLSQLKSFVMLYVGIGKVNTRPLASPSAMTLQKGLVEKIHLVLKFFIGFVLGFASDDDILVCVIFWNCDIQGYVREWRLKPNAGRYINVKNELLQGLLDFFKSKAVVFDERRQKGIEIGKGLSTRCFSLERIKRN